MRMAITIGLFALVRCTILDSAATAAALKPVYPGTTWVTAQPADRGMDANKLKAFSSYVGGRGCVVRHGRMVHTWGDVTKRADVASAAKPYYSYFLFKAIEEGKIDSFDEKVVVWEPRLDQINKTLGAKDRDITWRHFANQTSCYQLADKPGTAFAYNDWQTALFWDTLFQKVFGAKYEDVDQEVFHPLLTDLIGCQDQPTFMAFGTTDRPGRVAVSVRDFARFGLLYLRHGRWMDRQLISPQHAKMAVSSPLSNSLPRTAGIAAEMIAEQRTIGSERKPDNQSDHFGGYSWFWWTNGVDRHGTRMFPDAPVDTYGAFGHGGPRAMWVIPSLDMVVSYNDADLQGWTSGRENPTNHAMKLLVDATTESSFPERAWRQTTPAAARMDEAQLDQARRYALTGEGAGMVVRHGKIVMEWGDTNRRYDLKSTTKSIGGTAIGLALMDQKVKLSDRAQQHHPKFGTPPDENTETGWLGKITLQHLATQTAGFDKPGGYEKLLFRPGAKWSYSDGGPNWLAECLTIQYGRDLRDVLFERVFTPIGITAEDLTWRENAYRPAEIEGIPRREFGSGISANVDAMARIGLLYLHDGRWNAQQLIPKSFVRLVGQPLAEVVDLPEYASEHGEKMGNASAHYGFLWWNNADATLKNVPRDAYWTWGLYDSLIVVVPSLDLVIARAGKSFEHSFKERGRTDHYGVLRPFVEPIAQSILGVGKTLPEQHSSSAPYPPSKVITNITWAPKESIIRRAEGSDNWPMTWADDGHQYTAYGDGRGFQQAAPKKLSMGLAKVMGSADDFHGVNIVSPTGEDVGDDVQGGKASGMLMVEGTLYMWVRNMGNSQLRWSDDHGVSWQQANWKLTTSFGCPTFLNFGQNYAGARDDFVYIYSHDRSSAYEPADRMVAARVSKDRIKDQKAYQFFERFDPTGKPLWTDEIERRGPIFQFPQNCYRNGMTYNAGLKRYLWCQILPPVKGTPGPRFEGGFGIYDAPEPWGPWTTVYFTERWDVGPGETSSFPTKWMSDDGKKVHLISSGDDHFSVRAATLTSEPVVQGDSSTYYGTVRPLNPRLVEMPTNRWLQLHQQKRGDRVHFSRQEHGGSCFDTKRGRLILFGSNTHGKNWFNSPFVFDPAEETWSQLHPHDPRDTYAVNKSGIGVAGPRGDHPWAMHAFGALVYDVARDEMVVASHPGHMVPGRFTDSVAELWPDVKKFPTWTFDLEREQWKPLACDAVSFFPYCAAYDLQQKVILGHKPDGIFELGGKPRVWEQRTQQVFLKGWHTNAVYDAGEQALVVFGVNTNSNDIEVFYPSTRKHRLMPTPGRRPPKDQHNPMAYVPELGQTAVVVDRAVELDDQKSRRVAEIWLYNLSADSWTPIPKATLPFACGMNYHMQYDPDHKCLLLVTSGRAPEVGPGTGETTVWALRIELP